MCENIYNIPILLIFFNRSDSVIEVIDSISKVKPQKLYLVSDGPRNKEEKDIVDQVRDTVINLISWDCEIIKNFRDENFGCMKSVKEGIDWFFSNEEYGIILEDDTVADCSFYFYCSELLLKYENDDRIGMISGNNHIDFFPESESSYLFSKFAFTWGWATWRRAWKNMDLEMSWVEKRFYDVIKNMSYRKKFSKHWENRYFSIINNKVSAWDYQWFFSLATQNQLCIFPRVNLVKNIGVNQGTHIATFRKEYIKNDSIILPLKHPDFVLPFNDFETLYEDEMLFLPKFLNKIVPESLKNIIKKTIKL